MYQFVILGIFCIEIFFISEVFLFSKVTFIWSFRVQQIIINIFNIQSFLWKERNGKLLIFLLIRLLFRNHNLLKLTSCLQKNASLISKGSNSILFVCKF